MNSRPTNVRQSFEFGMVLRADVRFDGPAFKCQVCDRLLDHSFCRVCKRQAFEIILAEPESGEAFLRSFRETIERERAKEATPQNGAARDKTVDEIVEDFMRGVWPDKAPPAGGPDLV